MSMPFMAFQNVVLDLTEKILKAFTTLLSHAGKTKLPKVTSQLPSSSLFSHSECGIGYDTSGCWRTGTYIFLVGFVMEKRSLFQVAQLGKKMFVCATKTLA